MIIIDLMKGESLNDRKIMGGYIRTIFRNKART